VACAEPAFAVLRSRTPTPPGGGPLFEALPQKKVLKHAALYLRCTCESVCPCVKTHSWWFLQVNAEAEGRDEQRDEGRQAAEMTCTEIWDRGTSMGTAVRPQAKTTQQVQGKGAPQKRTDHNLASQRQPAHARKRAPAPVPLRAPRACRTERTNQLIRPRPGGGGGGGGGAGIGLAWRFFKRTSIPSARHLYRIKFVNKICNRT
jgi:hypothetical protein